MTTIKNNLTENINKIKKIMGLLVERINQNDVVKIYSDGQGSSDSEEYVGEVIQIPVKDVIANEPFKDKEYMEKSDSVRRIIKDLKNRKKIDPIKVVRHPYNENKYMVIDGNHRIYAFKKMGEELIDVVVIPYSDIVLVKGSYGDENQDFIPLEDVKDNKKIIDNYFVKPDQTHEFEQMESTDNLNEETEPNSDYDFNKTIYVPEDKSVVGAYMITNENENSIEVLNIKELPDGKIYFDNSISYAISIQKVKLPKSQIKIVKEIEGKPGFYFIKIPYWLYKKNEDELKVSRINRKRRVNIPDRLTKNTEFIKKLSDPKVIDYMLIVNPDKTGLGFIDYAIRRSQLDKNEI